MSTPKMANARRQRLLQYLDRYNALKAELQTIGFICPGSLQTRRLACGNPNCRCQQDPESRHGPYHYWTRKQRGKTVGLKLTDAELAIYSEWIENNRKLERILRQMRALSAHALGLTSGKMPL